MMDGTSPVLGPGRGPLDLCRMGEVFNEYIPPRTAVAEAWVHADRRGRYASPEGLGQAFNFDLLQAAFDAGQFREIITRNLTESEITGASSTWVFSNHDVVRHATRYGLPKGPGRNGPAQAWLLSGGKEPALDREQGVRRARAATLLMLALPGSAYLYQGEELGLHEVIEISDADRQDPAFFRNPGVDIGRDGCRVPLPWTPKASRSGSVKPQRTCRSRNGSAPTPWQPSRTTPNPRSRFTARHFDCAAAFRPKNNSNGSTNPMMQCCTSSGPTAGSR